MGAKKPKAGLKLKVKAKKPALKVKAKVGAKAKVAVKKPKAKVSLKVKAKKARRMQMTVSNNGVDLNNARFAANVPQPTAIQGDGQTAPAKSWMMFTGLMTLVAVLLN